MAPKTLRGSREVGKREYEMGKISSDTYHIERPLIPHEDSVLRLQLKEVEPEESYIDYLALTKVTYPAGAMLVSNPEHSRLHAFARAELEALHNMSEVRATLVRKGDRVMVSTSPAEAGEELMLEPGEVIEVTGVVAGGEQANPFVLIRSRYRDWTAGVISEFEDTKKELRRSPLSFITSPRVAAKTLALVVLSGFIWLGGLATRESETAKGSAQTLAQHFSVPTAHADACHSLVVEYYDWNASGYREIAIVQPRHYRATLEAAELPVGSVSRAGEVRVRITATKRHAVSLASLFVAETTYDEEVSRESLALTAARNVRTGEEYTELLNNRLSGEYMHIVPSDVVELTFESSQKTVPHGYTTTYTLEAAGFYTPLSAEGRAQAGDWVPRLDPEAQQWLREMYALKDYRKAGKKPVLSQ